MQRKGKENSEIINEIKKKKQTGNKKKSDKNV